MRMRGGGPCGRPPWGACSCTVGLTPSAGGHKGPLPSSPPLPPLRVTNPVPKKPLSESPVAQPPGGDGAASASSAPALPLVGCAQELALLDHLLTDGPPVLLVAGEPGIGKSRLLQAGIEREQAQGWTVLTGSCHRRSGQEPYAPLLGRYKAVAGSCA